MKHCDICNIDIMKKNWSRHLKTKKHSKNDKIESEIKVRKYKCEHCNLELSSRQNLWRHINRNRCPVLKSIEKKKKNILELLNKLYET